VAKTHRDAQDSGRRQDGADIHPQLAQHHDGRQYQQSYREGIQGKLTQGLDALFCLQALTVFGPLTPLRAPSCAATCGR
jgi:hypothetical protein